MQHAASWCGVMCGDTALSQSLSTCQLDPQQSANLSLDLLTGFQLADGALRLVVLEGPAEGIGMARTIAGIARCVWLAGNCWQSRQVLLTLWHKWPCCCMRG